MAQSEIPADLAVAALPYRLGRHGLEILLISSRETRGWVIPMGTPSEERHPHRTAEIEAFHAAGVKGAISRRAIGAYALARRPAASVEVYPLLVSNEAATWPEKNQRRRVWFPGKEAAEKVEEAGLAQLIREWQESRIESGRGMAKQARGRGGSRHG
ncbi:NUDIX hydrolase [Acidisoma sp. 7E03]